MRATIYVHHAKVPTDDGLEDIGRHILELNDVTDEEEFKNRAYESFHGLAPDATISFGPISESWLKV